MLDLSSGNLEADDLADIEIVVVKATNKVQLAETEIIKEEERRTIEEAAWVSFMHHW